MIQIDRQRCGYCGSCVSVCPADALVLQETHLHVRKSCIDCGKCVKTCPMGALSLELCPSAGLLQSQSYDLVVVGAGPSGSTAARYAALNGLSVLLLDSRQEIGSPVQCAEGVSHEQLAPFITPDPQWISATIQGARAAVRDASGREAALETSVLEASVQGGATGYVLERRVFDRVLAERAAAAGAQVMLKTRVTGLLRQDGQICGVEAVSSAGCREIAAKIVIAADGVASLVGRWAGLQTTLPARDLMTCAQYLLAGIEIDSERTCYYIDEQIAPGGYAWIFPKGPQRANVGLGVQADLAEMAPLAYLQRFIERYPFLSRGRPVSLIVGGVPVGLARRLVTDGLLLVGDAARQVDPLTGGGITNGMMAGKLAAEVSAQAIAARDVSAGFLGAYESRWDDALGRKMARNYRLRERFPPGQRADPRFLQVFSMAVGGK